MIVDILSQIMFQCSPKTRNLWFCYVRVVIITCLIVIRQAFYVVLSSNKIYKYHMMMLQNILRCVMLMMLY